MSSQSITCTCIFYIGTCCQRSLHADLSLNKGRLCPLPDAQDDP